MPVSPVPPGFQTVTPYLVVDGAKKLIEFLKKGLNAKEDHRTERPDGGIMHAQLQLGTSKVMIADQMPGFPARPTALYLYVPECDKLYKQALAAGGTSIMEPADQFYGDRHGGVTDPCGNQWWIATHIEDVAEEELARRAQDAMKKRAEAHK